MIAFTWVRHGVMSLKWSVRMGQEISVQLPQMGGANPLTPHRPFLPSCAYDVASTLLQGKTQKMVSARGKRVERSLEKKAEIGVWIHYVSDAVQGRGSQPHDLLCGAKKRGNLY